MDEQIRLVIMRYDDDLWLDRMNQLDPLVHQMQQLDSRIATEWVQFIKFLQAECTGSEFKLDKQWSQLLNLMQISRKLNHRSVRFRDIIRNRLIIMSNSRRIRQLNQAARSSNTIELSLSDLERHIKLQQLELSWNDDHEIMIGQMLKQVKTSSAQLKDKCKPLLYHLKLELDNSLISDDGQFDVWSKKVIKFDRQLSSIESFLNLMYRFHEKWSHLKPLLAVDSDTGPRDSRVPLNDSVNNSKKQFIDIEQFYSSLMNYLQDLVPLKSRLDRNLRTQVVFLIRLLDPKTDKLASELCSSSLEANLESLGKIQCRLDRLMSELRLEFGRFYFVSDIELLHIICSDLKILNDLPENRRLITKLFNGSIDSFLLDRDHIVGIQSPFGETIYLSSEDCVALKKKFNLYSLEILRVFNELLRKVRKTLKRTLLISLRHFKIERTGQDVSLDDSNLGVDWSIPIQLLILAERLKFCHRVEQRLRESMDQRSLDDLRGYYEARFYQLVRQDVKSRSQLEYKEEYVRNLKRSAAISTCVEFLSILDDLGRDQSKFSRDWLWLKQVRYYWPTESQDRIIVHIGSGPDCRFDYRFDLLPIEIVDVEGHPHFKRLVHTDLSLRCHMVSSHAVAYLNLGANPYGPAGSGKTETIKTLGHMVGSQVIVHNCDQSNETSSMERLIWGLAHTGMWGCLDEFNRLSSGVLSAVSNTLEQVQNGLRRGDRAVELVDGGSRLLDPDSAFFLTLNPSGSSEDNKHGYRGRRQLPANLKSLFLPIAMIRLPLEPIIRESLLIMGGELTNELLTSDECRNLGQKLGNFMTAMKLIKINSTVQWDLRILTAILKRYKMRLSTSQTPNSDVGKDLKCAVWSELGPRILEVDRTIVKDALQQHLGDGNIEELSGNMSIQLNSQLETHLGVLLIGPSGSGKSEAWKSLGLQKKTKVKWIALGPDSCERDELFGWQAKGPQGNWIDGLLTSKVREAQALLQDQSANLDQVWLLLDGVLDSDWVESLNSVLDDNQVLTLGSGERLNFSLANNKSIKIIFESDQTDLVSAATISRVGLVQFEIKPHDRSSPDEFIGSHIDAVTSFLKHKNGGLQVVYGPSRDSVLSAEILSPEHGDFRVYNCNPSTRLGNIREFIQNNTTNPAIFKNIHLLGEDYKTEVLEFLRLLLTYQGFYSINDEKFSFIEVESTFKIIISVDEMSYLPKRLLNLSKSTLNVSFSGYDTMTSSQDVKMSLRDLLTDHSYPIVTWQSDTRGFGRRARLVQELNNLKPLAERRDSEVILQFRTNIEASDSVNKLEVALLNTDPSTRGQIFAIICQLELWLLSRENQALIARLFHSLNELRDHSRNFKFIYLSQKFSDDNLGISSRTLWSSFGPIITDVSYHPPIAPLDELIRERFSYLADHNDVCERISKFYSYMTESRGDLSADRKRVDDFCLISSDLIQRFQFNVKTRRDLLLNGLNRLSQLELTLQTNRQRYGQDQGREVEQGKQISDLVRDLDQSITEASSKRRELDKLGDQQEIKRTELQSRRKELAARLAEVGIKLDNSRQEVERNLKPEALNEIRALRAPPESIRDVLEVLFVFLGHTDTSWSAIKSYLAKRSLRDELTQFDFRQRVASKQINRTRDLMLKSTNSFDDRQIARASTALLPIVRWLRAALNYSEVIIQLRPLETQTESIETEAAKIDKLHAECQREQQRLAHKIDVDSARLKVAQEDHFRSSEANKVLLSELDKAEKCLTRLSSQVDRWRAELTSLEILSDPLVIGLAMFGSAMSTYGDFLSTNIDVDSSLRIFGLENQSRAEAVKLLFNLATDLNLGSRQPITSLEEQLVYLRLLIDAPTGVTLKPIIRSPPDANNNGCDNWLSSERVELEGCGQIEFIERQDCKDQFELASRLGRLVILETSKLDLDLISQISERNHKVILKVTEIDSPEEVQKLTRSLFRSFTWHSESVCNENKEEDYFEKILSHLVRLKEPILAATLNDLKNELSTKKKQASDIETNILRQIAKSSTSNQFKHENDEPIIRALGHLYESGKSVEQDQGELVTKLRGLRDRQMLFQDQARLAAKFYKDKILMLDDRVDRLPFLSIDRFVDLYEQGGLTRVAQRVVNAMRHDQRVMFEADFDRWCDILPDGTKQQITTSPMDLKTALESLLEKSQRDRKGANCLKLVIIEHDQGQSSPQLELDELFAKINSDFRYSKLYATGHNDSFLEKCLKSLLVQPKANEVGVDISKRLVICLANAHLSAQWCNLHLSRLLDEITQGQEIADAVIGEPVLILVRERLAFEHQQQGGAESRLLDRADLVWWYEELRGLNAFDRYHLYISRLPAISGVEGGSLLDISKTCGNQQNTIAQLVRRTVGLHVSCQEVAQDTRQVTTKAVCNPVEPGWRHLSSYEQLSLALKWLEMDFKVGSSPTIGRPTIDPSLLWGRQLEQVIYGSRMESLEGEIALGRLVAFWFEQPVDGMMGEQLLAGSVSDGVAEIVAKLKKRLLLSGLD